MAYIPALDGVRGVAVLGVLLLHFRFSGVPGGGIGVDIFFVLSGFLITRVLLAGYARGDPLAIFYWHRFVRLFPALLFLCAIYLAFGLIFLDKNQTWLDLESSLSYAANWTRAFVDGAPQYLGHTWSTAIEEQFYLLWPALLLLILRATNKNFCTLATLSLLAVVFVWRHTLLADGASFDRIYNGSDTRCDGLLLGCILGLSDGHAWFAKIRRVAALAVPISLAATLALYALIPWSPTSAPLINAVAAVLVLGASEPDNKTRFAFLLNNPAICFIGRISYSLYLWHYPIGLFLYYHLRLPFWKSATIGIPASFFFAILSYYLVERSCLRLRDKPGRAKIAVLGQITASLAVLSFISGITYFSYSDVAQWLNPKPFTVLDYGPKSVVEGSPFNVQPNGDSMLWILTSVRPGPGTSASIEDRPVKAFLSSIGLAIVVPQDIIERAGTWHVQIASRSGAPLGQPFQLTIVPK
jgi:peptidoglycan/LPS O-acetylase OafA/YrhL